MSQTAKYVIYLIAMLAISLGISVMASRLVYDKWLPFLVLFAFWMGVLTKRGFK